MSIYSDGGDGRHVPLSAYGNNEPTIVSATDGGVDTAYTLDDLATALGGGGGGTLTGTLVQLGNSPAEPGASGTQITWGGDNADLSSAPVYRDLVTGAVTSKPNWLTLTDANDPILEPGTYTVGFIVTADNPITTSTSMTIAVQVSRGHPTQTFNTIPLTDQESTQQLQINAQTTVETHVGAGVLLCFIMPGNSAGTLGTVNYSAQIYIAKLA